jgi:transposase-like protein
MTSNEDKRQIRALAISSAQLQIKRINKLRYRVRSQSDDEICYEVEKGYGHNLGGHQEGEWICSCPDFQHRRIVCKHIYAVLFRTRLRKKVVQSQPATEQSSFSRPSHPLKCPKCESSRIIKKGIRRAKNNTIQRYKCKSCSYRFIDNVGFERSKSNPKAVSAALDLYFKGVSFRKVGDHLKQFHSVTVSHVAIINWVRKFVDVVKPYVDSITAPHLSGIYHVDEMMVHVRREEMEIGHYQWLWNLMDNTTRFWISTLVSQRREIADARAIFQDSKKKSTAAKAIIHDGLRTYDEAFQKEYFRLKIPRVQNIRSISVRNQGLNSKVERLHGTIREREKVMRGMQTKETSQKIIEAMRIHYNFIREHSTLGKTPAQKAGIQLDLQGNKIENLIRLTTNKRKAIRILI